MQRTAAQLKKLLGFKNLPPLLLCVKENLQKAKKALSSHYSRDNFFLRSMFVLLL